MVTLKIRIKIFLFILIIILIAFDGYYFFIRKEVGPTYYFKHFFGKKVDPIFENQIYEDYVGIYEYLNRKEKRKNLIVFIGDSIIARFNVYEYFFNYPVLNRGIFSDTTEGLKKRLPINFNNIDVEKCFLLIGHNDLKYRENNEILSNYEEILKSIEANEIYVLSLLPVRGKTMDFKLRLSHLNRMLRKRANLDGDNIYFIDIFSIFVNRKGEIKRSFSSDGVHPNDAGYQALKTIIYPFL